MQALAVLPLMAQTGSNPIAGLLPLVLMGVAFWFLLIRPQQQRARKQRELVASIGRGDRVISIGGLHGTVETVDEDTVRLEVADGTVITLARAAIARRLVDADAPADGTGDHGVTG
ncbi:MAG: preprotein translocase subunit YajC [Actinomycetota bacterium]|nr:preprotein translocase subunit YajC [Actinomycetota bacterium]